MFRIVVNYILAVDGVSFKLREKETLGFTGESGCGKSTVGRSVLHLIRPTEGNVIFDGKDLGNLTPNVLRKQRIHMQMIFQNPLSSLNPRLTVQEILTGAPLFITES